MNNKYINDLKKIINEEYGIAIDEMSEASRGVDGETWIINSMDIKYFVKIAYYSSHKQKFINSINTLNLINNYEINHVNHIIKTKTLKDYVLFNDRVLAIYNFVNGNIDYNYPYDKIIELLIPIYKISSIENLDYEKYDIFGLIDETKQNIEKAKEYKELNEILNINNSLIVSYFDKIKEYYFKMDKNKKKFITHGDACVNCMVDNDNVVLIDFDDTLVAPIERDCWFFVDSKQKISYINNCLKEHDIDYELSYDLLAFYAYKSALIYLNDSATKYMETQKKDILSEIDEILNGWVRRKIQSIDNEEE